MELQKTIHIQLFDEEGRIVSERLVKQDPEFNLGPKDNHKGPLRVMLTLTEGTDVEKAIVYLNKLRGELPLGAPAKTRGRTPGSGNSAIMENSNRYEQVLADVLALNGDQDKFINYLRAELGYIFVTGDFLKTILPETYTIKEVFLNKYQFLIKRIKEAKDPKNDRFDPVLIFGIQIIGERTPKVLVFMHGNLSERLKIQLPEKKAITVKSTNLLIYPKYMTEEERYKFGNEHRALFRDQERKPSKFYLRWYKDVKVGDELKFKVDERL